MQPFPEQPFGQLGVAAARSDEVGERAEDPPPVQASLEQRLRAGRETDVFAIELGQHLTEHPSLAGLLFAHGDHEEQTRRRQPVGQEPE